ncbi:DNA polymerase III subunit gamma/tau [Desulfopila sp. IMCC35008]|uniref:DNA polymerase III subunit gamma/tau n=1 Tax=Desulfopila sp. IMCC35008 TaxID=2653858 RepID=UPI0013D56690|nr:DNA polymerase III subunit gamma/tau [Desulfopila sp. IMCC35008]
MSYLVLARKSRPQTFSEVVGQGFVVKTLQNSIRKNRVAHAILFSGVRGVGKTTLARIMAKAVNCDSSTETPPCNECNPCREITSGAALDLIEIDGASNRGIQEIRELKEKIKFAPSSCRFKIIIIDEVHMLTTEAFNALLKTLEEPPPHVKFMFATTERHKIPITILSRCQQYELKRIPAKELTSHFTKLAEGENIAIEPQAIALIVREAEGSVRDGLSLLDQVFSFGEKQITVEDVAEVLGLVNRDLLIQLVAALLQGDRKTALVSLDQLYSGGMDLKRFTADLLDCFRTLLLTRINGCNELIDLPPEELERFTNLVPEINAQTIHLKLNLLMNMVEEVRNSSQPRLAIETGLLRMMEAANVVPVSDILDKINQLTGGFSGLEDGAVQPVTAEPEKTTEPPVKKKELLTPPTDQQLNSQPESGVVQPKEETEPPILEEQPPLPSEMAGPPLHDTYSEPPQPVEIRSHEKDIRKDWPDFLEYVKDRKVWMSQLLNRSDSVKEAGNELHIHYNDPAECSLLRQKENKTELTEFVLDFFQKDLTVHFILPEEEINGDEQNGESPREKRNKLANDPLTVMTAEIFNGEIGDIRIGPRSR